VLHKVPGYRRSQRYKLGPPIEDLTLEKAPPYVAIHEVDDVNRFFSGPEHAAAWSDWTKKQVADAKVFVVRGWEKIHASGY